MVVRVLQGDVEDLDADALIVGFHEDVRPLKGTAGALDWLLCGALSRLVVQKKIRGNAGEVALLTSRGKVAASKIFLVGLGRRDAPAESLRAAAKAAALSAVQTDVARAALDCFPLGVPADDAVAAVTAGLAEGSGVRPIEFTLLAPDAGVAERMARIVRA